MDLRTNAAEAVTNQLRRELLDGTIAPGSRILPKDLAERFAVSVVPVGEALGRLEAENLIVTPPQRAANAADWGARGSRRGL
jgi:DNA-binding GntR family transcriptional regulator